MINLEVFRLELNYLKQVIKGIIGDKASKELGEANVCPFAVIKILDSRPRSYYYKCLLAIINKS